MPVPNTMQDLATLASSNFPTGTESIGNSLDDYLRAAFAIIRSTSAISGATIASASTTDLASSSGEYVTVTGTTTINSFGTGFAGCKREVRFSNGLVIVNSASITLPGGLNLSTIAGDTLKFRCTAPGVWALSGGWRDVGAVRKAGDNMTGALGVADAVTIAGTSSNSIFARINNNIVGGRSYSLVSSGGGPSPLGTFGIYDNTANLLRMSLDASGQFAVGASPAGAMFDIQTPTNNGLRVTDGTRSGVLYASGLGGIAIGTTSNHPIIFLANNSNVGNVDQSGNLTVNGNLISLSDMRLKSDVTQLVGAMEIVRRGRGVRYTKDGKAEIGFIADEMLKAAPEVVSVPQDPRKMKGVAYAHVTPILWEAIKEIDARLSGAGI